MFVRPFKSIPSIISTAKWTSSRRRLISTSRFSRFLATNSRLTADFDVERACASTFSPTGSRVRSKRRVETPASICSSANRVRVAIGEVLIGDQRHLLAAIGRAHARALHSYTAPTKGHLAILVAVAQFARYWETSWQAWSTAFMGRRTD
jgi:hypothetical protein